MISYPFMSLTQPGDPLRHPLVMHDDTFVEPYHPQQLVATTAMPEPPTAAPTDVDMHRHTLV